MQVVRPLDPVVESLLAFESDSELVAMIDAIFKVRGATLSTLPNAWIMLMRGWAARSWWRPPSPG